MEEEMSLYDKIADALDFEGISDAVNSARDNVRNAISDMVDKFVGKESSFSIDFEDVGLQVGEERRFGATGSIKVSLSTFK